MKEVNISIQLVGSALMSAFTFLLGGFDSLLTTLFVFMFIDYLTGILKGIYNKEINSKIGLKGIIKKFGYIMKVILATFFDRIINDGNTAVRTLVLYFFVSNEAISILENWASLGLPLPKKLFEIFSSLKSENEHKVSETINNT